MAQLLSGSNMDELATSYLAAVEKFEKEAQSVFSELGGRGNTGEASSTGDTSAAAAAPGITITTRFSSKIYQKNFERSNYAKLLKLQKKI